MPFPGLNIDNLPFFAVIAAVAEGQTLMHDWVYENRAIYLTELTKLGGQVKLLDPHRVMIEGPTRWSGTEIVCPPALRPAVVILLAMLAVEGHLGAALDLRHQPRLRGPRRAAQPARRQHRDLPRHLMALAPLARVRRDSAHRARRRHGARASRTARARRWSSTVDAAVSVGRGLGRVRDRASARGRRRRATHGVEEPRMRVTDLRSAGPRERADAQAQLAQLNERLDVRSGATGARAGRRGRGHVGGDPRAAAAVCGPAVAVPVVLGLDQVAEVGALEEHARGTTAHWWTVDVTERARRHRGLALRAGQLLGSHGSTVLRARAEYGPRMPRRAVRAATLGAMAVHTARVTRPRTGFPFLDAGPTTGAVLAFAHRGGARHPDLRGPGEHPGGVRARRRRSATATSRPTST